MRKARAAVFDPANKSFSVNEYPISEPAAGNVGLSLRFSGICGTDVHIFQGKLGPMPFPLILGHEFTGKIEAIGKGVVVDKLCKELSKGDNVIACVAIPCGKCLNCRQNEAASCLAFGVTYVKPADQAPHFHGGFAEYLEIPAENVVCISAHIDVRAAAAFPCGGPTILRACKYGGGLKAGELVVVQGNGALGLFAVAYAKAQGCFTVCIGSTANEKRLRATEALAPDRFIDFRKVGGEALQTMIRDEAKRLNRGDGADVCIETSGDPAAFKTGLALLRTRGRYFVPGQYSDRGEISIPPHQITFRALRIIGSGQYTMADIGEYLDFLGTHPRLQESFASMVSTYAVSDVVRAMDDAAEGRVIKAVFSLA